LFKLCQTADMSNCLYLPWPNKKNCRQNYLTSLPAKISPKFYCQRCLLVKVAEKQTVNR
jgi:hypothetical protein